MKIIIAGAGRGGLNLAVHLQKRGHAVVIIERDPIIAIHASDTFGIAAIQGDATDAAILRQTDPARADAVLTMLHRDADNLGVALLARSLGAKRIIVRMRDPDYRSVYEDVGIHQILSETEILVGALATAIEFEAVRHSMALGGGDAIAFEITIASDSWVVGQSVSDIAASPKFPSSCVVAGMVTPYGRIQTPRGGSIFEEGMNLLLVASRDDLARAIGLFLETQTEEVSRRRRQA